MVGRQDCHISLMIMPATMRVNKPNSPHIPPKPSGAELAGFYQKEHHSTFERNDREWK